MVYIQGQNFPSNKNGLSMVTQADTLWVGIATDIFGCMHVSFPPKEHDITRALHGDMGSDMTVTWASGHDVIVKGI